MPTDRPSAPELLKVVRMHLEQHTAPLLEGHAAFHLRVAINALMIVERTLAEGGEMDRAEQERLCALLDTSPDEASAARKPKDADELAELNRQLATQIRAGEWDGRSQELLAHLQQTAADKLRLANPRYRSSRQ